MKVVEHEGEKFCGCVCAGTGGRHEGGRMKLIVTGAREGSAVRGCVVGGRDWLPGRVVFMGVWRVLCSSGACRAESVGV